MWLNIGLSWKIKDLCVFWLFIKIALCSAISFKRSRWELSIDVAKHMSTLKNYWNTHYPHFSFVPKIGVAFPKTFFFLRVLEAYFTWFDLALTIRLYGCIWTCLVLKTYLCWTFIECWINARTLCCLFIVGNHTGVFLFGFRSIPKYHFNKKKIIH